MNLPIGLLTCLGQRFQKILTVHVILVNVLAPIPAAHHMVYRPRDNQSAIGVAGPCLPASRQICKAENSHKLRLDPSPTRGALYPYVKTLPVYKCPGDPSLALATSFPTLRSYSLSCYLGGPPEDREDFGLSPLTRASQIRKPSATLGFLEEDISSIDDGHFLYVSATNKWMNIPGWRHQNGAPLGFADQHVEYWKWRGALKAANTIPASLAGRQDLQRLQQTAPDAGNLQAAWDEAQAGWTADAPDRQRLCSEPTPTAALTAPAERKRELRAVPANGWLRRHNSSLEIGVPPGACFKATAAGRKHHRQTD
jgi:hypothetical protein